MKRLGILLTMLLTTVIFSNAQPRQFDPEERAKRQTEELVKVLELSKDQAPQIEAINLKYGKKMAELFKGMRNGGGNREAMMKKRKEMQDNQTKEIKEVLSVEQFGKYEKFIEEKARNRQSQGRNR